MRNDKDRTKTMNTDRDMEGNCGASTSSFFLRRDRGGTVLVIVVAILAVLMVFAATLALTSRVEKKASENYEIDQALGLLRSSVEQYAVDILRTDKYGDDGIPYNYEQGADTPIYTNLREENDENFDAYEIEEWLPENSSFFAYSGSDTAFYRQVYNGEDSPTYYVYWQNCDEIMGGSSELMGGEVEGEVALLFFDVGGSRLDVNSTGNYPQNQNQGISPFETDLVSIVEDDSPMYISYRYGQGETSPQSDTHLYGTADLDFDADGTVETSVPSGAPGYFNPDWPTDPESPLDTSMLNDMLFNPAYSYDRSITTASGTTIIAGRSIRGDAWNYTNPSTHNSSGNLGFYGVLKQSSWPQDDKDNSLVVQRSVQDMINTGSAEDLRDFLLDLDPVSPVPDDSDVFMNQIAVNVIDMVDTDIQVDTKVYSDSSDTYYGVEVTPYIAEVEAAIDTAEFPFRPGIPDEDDLSSVEPREPNTKFRWNDEDASGDDEYEEWEDDEEIWMDADGTGNYNDGDDTQIYDGGDGDWDTPDGTEGEDGEQPHTGWGKYIKLVNPWNEDINLSGMSLVFSGLKKWTFGKSGWSDESISGDYTLDLPDKTIPAHGHFLIVDNDADDGPFGSVVGSAVSDPVPHVECDTVTYMREGETTLELRDSGNNLIMQMAADATGESDSDNDSCADSTQIGDPRPCWYDPADDSTTSSPWELVEADTATYSDWDDGNEGTDGNELAWFNKNWRDDTADDTPVNSGDDYYLLNVDSGGTLDSPPDNADNLLHSFPPVKADTEMYTGVEDDETKIMNNGILPSPGAVGFVHAGIPWGTVSLTNPVDADDIGASNIVYLRNFTDYLVGPVSPFEDGVDEDGDGLADDIGPEDSGFSSPSEDRFGPEIRRRGKVNVNTAPPEVLESVLKTEWLDAMWDGDSPDGRAADIADDIVNERTENGPFSSVDDFFDRMPGIFEVDLNDDGSPDTEDEHPNTHRREALARFMYNLVTVRTDVWGVIGRVRLKDADSGNVISTTGFNMVVDRSFDPPRIILFSPRD